MDTLTLGQTLQAVFNQPERTTALFLSGGPGIGKTASVAQAAAAARKPLVTLALPTCEAVDLRGLPQAVDGRMRWVSPLPREGSGVLLLDEVSSAAPDVQVAAHHIVWAEDGSDMALPVGWHIVLTGNRATDKTLYRPMSGPLRNRLTQINVEAHPLQWADWASRAGVSPNVVAFIRWLPDALTVKEIPAEGAFPTPRAWVQASRVLSLAISPAAEQEMLTGTVGAAQATKFSAYLETVRSLPDIETIMADQKKAKLPKEPSLCYAITCSLAQYTVMRKQSAMEYIARLPADYGVLYIRDIRDRYEIREDKVIREWIGNHAAMFSDE